MTATAPDRIYQVDLRCTREDGLGFALYLRDPTLHLTGGNADLLLTEPARLFCEIGDDVLSAHDALRGAPGWLQDVGLWFGPLSGEMTEGDRAISAEAASVLSRKIGVEGMTLHVTFPDHARQSYAVATAFADDNQVTIRLVGRRG